jgi:site-specific recombinase XerD
VFDTCRDLTVVQHMLGHAHASTTSRYLRHADLSVMREAMEARPYAA